MSCRFYGHSGFGGVLMDTCGNQCALVLDSHAPCTMEIVEAPDERTCQLVTMAAAMARAVAPLPSSVSDADAALVHIVMYAQMRRGSDA